MIRHIYLTQLCPTRKEEPTQTPAGGSQPGIDRQGCCCLLFVVGGAEQNAATRPEWMDGWMMQQASKQAAAQQ